MNFVFKILKVEFTNKKSYPTTISFEIEIKFLEMKVHKKFLKF